MLYEIKLWLQDSSSKPILTQRDVSTVVGILCSWVSTSFVTAEQPTFFSWQRNSGCEVTVAFSLCFLWDPAPDLLQCQDFSFTFKITYPGEWSVKFTPYINSPVISRSQYSVDFAICMGKREKEHVNRRCPVAREPVVGDRRDTEAYAAGAIPYSRNREFLGCLVSSSNKNIKILFSPCKNWEQIWETILRISCFANG